MSRFLIAIAAVVVLGPGVASAQLLRCDGPDGPDADGDGVADLCDRCPADDDRDARTFGGRAICPSACVDNQRPVVDCEEVVEVALDEACEWSVEAEALANATRDPDGHATRCTSWRERGAGYAVTPVAIACEDVCGAPNRNFCESIVVPRDVTPPEISVANPVVTFALEDGAVSGWNDIATVCGLDWIDNCHPAWAAIRGLVGVDAHDPAEQMGGGPGLFISEGLVADWFGFMLDLDGTRARPRAYTLTFVVGDASNNWAEVQCEIRIEGGDATCDGIDDDHDGAIDEDFRGKPIVCGHGACARDGETICVDGWLASACRPDDVVPVDEICNGEDDDCDGEIDEGFRVGAQCTADTDLCGAPQAAGVAACDADGGLTCVAEACFAEPPRLEEAEAPHRYVGATMGGCAVPVAPLGCCPAAPDPRWVGRRLFEDPVPMPPGWVRPGAPAETCLYVWDAVGPPEPGGLPADGPLLPSMWLAPDRHVVVALADPPTDAYLLAQNELEQAYLEAIDALPVLPTPPGLSPESVVVAVIDSALDEIGLEPVVGVPGAGVPGDGFSPHGRVIGLIAQRLACPGCAEPAGPDDVQVSNHLALDLVSLDDGPDRLGGGVFGYQSTLAEQIHAAVVHRALAFPGTPLVINLSVGWDPYFNDYPVDDLRRCVAPGPVALNRRCLVPSAQAVLVALEHATCQGALVVAAAGNTHGGPDAPPQLDAGPMYPAAWEALPSICGAAGTAYTPLLFAAGGVDGRDRPLTNARPGGHPPIVAPGLQVTFDDDALRWVDTGSSLAAAATSGVAAAVWRYLPDRAPADIMQVVYDAAVALGGVPGSPPDFALACAGPGCPRVVKRRVSACRAIAAAVEMRCADDGIAPCPVPVCDTPDAWLGDNPGLSAAVRDAFPAAAEDVDWEPIELMATVPGCPGPSKATPTRVGPDFAPCPTRQLPKKELVPWVVPQPGSPGCTICEFYFDGAAGTATAYLGINPQIASGLHSPRIVLNTGEVLKLDGTIYDPLIGGTTYKLVTPPLAGSIKTAHLEYVYKNDAGKWTSGEESLVVSY